MHCHTNLKTFYAILFPFGFFQQNLIFLWVWWGIVYIDWYVSNLSTKCMWLNWPPTSDGVWTPICNMWPGLNRLCIWYHFSTQILYVYHFPEYIFCRYEEGKFWVHENLLFGRFGSLDIFLLRQLNSIWLVMSCFPLLNSFFFFLAFMKYA